MTHIGLQTLQSCEVVRVGGSASNSSCFNPGAASRAVNTLCTGPWMWWLGDKPQRPLRGLKSGRTVTVTDTVFTVCWTPGESTSLVTNIFPAVRLCSCREQAAVCMTLEGFSWWGLKSTRNVVYCHSRQHSLLTSCSFYSSDVQLLWT
jgi:hypothetical protein